MLLDIPPYLFVVDTDQYSGEFERELCGYMTGLTGECGVGQEEAELFDTIFEDNPFEDIVGYLPDGHGCSRPVTIWPTPGWFNNGMGGHFRQWQMMEAWDHYRQSCLEESNNEPYGSPEHNLKHKEKWVEKSKQKLSTYPAYQSVAILLNSKPSADILDILRIRAQNFCERKKINLINFRLIKLTLHEEEIKL